MGEERRMARALLEPPPGGAVLDLGCGTGAFTRDLAAAVGPDGLVVGLDASPTMLARAAAETSPGNVAYMRADAGRLPFRPAAFDAVCCFAALHPFPDPSAALDEMARVLTSGGRLAVLASRRTGAVPLRPLEARRAHVRRGRVHRRPTRARLRGRAVVRPRACTVRRRAAALTRPPRSPRVATPPPGSCPG
jgi:ubiquinone/menaquinone biosynthesis C-methylase UbiE